MTITTLRLDTFAEYVAECVPRHIWKHMCHICKLTANSRWGNLSPKKVRLLSDLVVAYPFDFHGKYISPHSAAFVNVGGVSLKQINMSTMASRMNDGLFFCGSVLDVDGTSIGYNRMLDWATGHVAGVSAANFVCEAAEEAGSS